ncbi:MAG: hypothetical protein U0838_17215 [Chloroflexota bacterium]
MEVRHGGAYAWDLVRVEEALAREWGLGELGADLAVTRAIQHAVAAGHGRVTIAVHEGRSIIAAWPGFRDRAFGVAIDVGSYDPPGTWRALLDGSVLASARASPNPQIAGGDLMSRVSYAMLHDRGATEMTAAVRTALRDLKSGASPRWAGLARDPRDRPRRQRSMPPVPGTGPRAARAGAVHARRRRAVHASAGDLKLGVHATAR